MKIPHSLMLMFLPLFLLLKEASLRVGYLTIETWNPALQ
jgi:hypothetical protein